MNEGPLMDFVAQRETLPKLWTERGEEKLAAYHAEKNTTSIDGLPTPLADQLP